MQNVIVIAGSEDWHRQFSDLGYPLVHCDADGRVSDLQSSSEVPLSDLHVNALCVLAGSSDGLESAERLSSRFISEIGAKPLPLVDLTSTQAGERHIRAMSQIIETLLRDRFIASQRQVELLRDLSHLRAEHEQICQSFSLLEDFVQRADLDHRQLTRELSPAINSRTVLVSKGSCLYQRLPGGSDGVCDIAVHIAKAPTDPDARLNVSLLSSEKDETVFEWTLAADELEAGWLRLPMGVALGPDNTTLKLQLDWSGNTPLELDWSLRHPDPRYCVQSDDPDATDQDDRVLALRLWTYIPGCTAPLSSRSGGRAGHVVSQENLKAALNLNPNNSDTKFIDHANALQVHPVRGDFAAALLCDVVTLGTVQVSAKIQSMSGKASDIDFSIALVPTSARVDHQVPRHILLRKLKLGSLRSALERAIADPGAIQSEWYRLSAGKMGVINMLLPAPTDEPMDLYLITRMANTGETPSWAWAVFSRVTLHRNWS